MAIFNYAAREMTAKIVYYGPGLSGKTTSIQFIHTKISPKSKGKLVSLATETDRTLFFDFFPVEFGTIGGFKVKFNFYTVPGQVFYNTTRKLVLKGADGVVFVADSQPGMMEQNVESLENLKENLKAHGIDWETVPFAIQFNKRDLPSVMPVEDMRRQLNPRGIPDFETSATTGMGVMDAMKAICKLVLEDIQNKQKRTAKSAKPKMEPAPEPVVTESPSKPAEDTPVEPQLASPANPPAQPAAAKTQTAIEESVERSFTVPVQGAGDHSISLALPLELRVEKGVEAVQVAVQVRVSYLSDGAGRVQVKELSEQSVTRIAAAGEGEKAQQKKGFFARIFGGG